MTVKELINAAERKGLKYEINTLLQTSNGKSGLYEIGINYRGSIWAWFKYFDNTDRLPHFRNAYNQANGRNDKSGERGSRIIKQI